MTTNQQADRLACPFCNCIVLGHCGFHMFCIRCGAEGPDADEDDEQSAIAAWNRRATLARTPSVPDDVARDALADEAARDARQDALRIDHLQHRGATVEILPSGHGGWFFRIGGLHRAVHADIRQAIDAARASHEGEQA